VEKELTKRMVQSSSSKKKKNSKKSKRKPVNLQPQYQSKFRKVISTSSPKDSSNDDHHGFPGGMDMYPSNVHENEDDHSQGDFHMHRFRNVYMLRICWFLFIIDDNCSVCSDGKYRPSEVIEKATQNGVVYMSLTDHDTMAGVQEAVETGRKLGVFVIPGVEISAEAKGSENLHILGYFCPGTESKELEEKLYQIRQSRHKRGKEMLRKLVGVSYIPTSCK